MAEPAAGGESPRSPRAAAGVMGRAILDGWLSCCAWPRRDLEKALPGALRLERPEGWPAERHPLLAVCGAVRRTRVVFGGIELPTGVDYDEFALLVPCVRLGRSEQLSTFAAFMGSTVLPAVLFGNAVYGFAKELVRIARRGTITVVTRADGALLAHLGAEARSPWHRRGDPAPRGLDALAGMLAQPTLGRRSDGTYARSRFEWGLGGADVRAAAAYVALDAGLAPGLGPGEGGDVADGSFEVRGMEWALAWPEAGEPGRAVDRRGR